MALTSLYNRIKESRPGLRLREFKHRVTFSKRYRPMREAMDRYRACTHRKPGSQIRAEMRLCRRFWGCYPLHYYRENLYRRDCSLSREELLNYVPEFFFYELFLPFYDSGPYQILLQDKIVTESWFAGLGIRQPQTLCRRINGVFYSRDWVPVKDLNEIMAELNRTAGEKVFVKPTDGSGGEGIHVFNRRGDGTYQTRHQVCFNPAFLTSLEPTRDYLVQAGVRQHAAISKIYPHSVNTFRVATENIKGAVRILLVEFRLGRDGRETDNTCQGGLNVHVDSETGLMGGVAVSDRGEILETHPDTGFVFRGQTVTDWPGIRAFAMAVAAKLPQFTYLGLDIALSEDGPLAIEANPGFGLDPQSVHGGVRDLLRIDDPSFYWTNTGKRLQR